MTESSAVGNAPLYSKRSVNSMAATRWDPLEGLATLRKEMDRAFEDFFRGRPFQTRESGALEPAVDVCETPDAVVVKAQMPGVRREHMQLTITEDTLTIKGEVQGEEEAKDRTFHRREIRHGSFFRAIPLPVAVRSEQAKARLKDGILEVTFPKSDQGKAQDIPIDVTE
jgi:HSP20 family protein